VSSTSITKSKKLVFLKSSFSIKFNGYRGVVPSITYTTIVSRNKVPSSEIASNAKLNYYFGAVVTPDNAECVRACVPKVAFAGARGIDAEITTHGPSVG
jgi:hypothetical protein